MPSRRLLLTAAPALGAWVLAGCSGFGAPGAFSLDRADLERLLERNFPLDRRLLEVVDVTLSAPRLALLPERNRVGLGLDLRLRDRLLGGNGAGRIGFDAGLRFEPADQTLRLAQVRVDTFSFEPLPPALRAQAERLGALLAERVLEDLSVYRLPPERQQQLRMAGVSPGSVTVTTRGIDFALAPVGR